MLKKNSAFDEKVKGIVSGRARQRVMDSARREDNVEDFAAFVKKDLNYFYERIVSSSLDMGATKGRALDLGSKLGLCAMNLAKQEDYDFEITSFHDSRRESALSGKFAAEEMVEDRLSSVVGEQEDLPFADRTFDMVMSGFDMHHWNDPVKVLNELNRILKVKGTLLIVDFRRDAFSLMSPALKGVAVLTEKEKMYRELKDSFNASYKKSEAVEIVKSSALGGCRVTRDACFVYIRRARREKRHVKVSVPGKPLG